jgi:predicted ATPase
MTLTPGFVPHRLDPELGSADHGLARQTRDALRHLHDPVALQVHPLVRLLALDGNSDAAGAGKALRRLLLNAVAALQPEPPSAITDPAWRHHRLLTLRYVEGQASGAVCQALAISPRQYDREHRRALDAVSSLLAAQLTTATTEAESPVRGVERGAIAFVAGPPAALSARLPQPLTSFVGRERELAAVQVLLTRTRLLTLVGPPGTGKTRLAIAAAARAAAAFPDGVLFAQLAPIRDVTLIGSALVRVLGLREGPARSALDTLVAYLERRKVLLLLDNFEHVLEAAPLVSDLLLACPGLVALATSRAPLRLSGEQEFAVPPLGLPPSGRSLSLADLARCEAVQLFLDRARAVRPDFVLTEEAGPAVSALCRRLDGLPLAIELAAARVRLLPPQALLDRLGGGQADGSPSSAVTAAPLQMLTGGPRDLPARQRTLREAIAWSYALLTSGEQRLLRQLAAFSGGWTLAAAETVVMDEGTDGDEESVLDRLESLVAQNLSVLERSATGEQRFLFLETIREYAWEQLVAHGTLEPVRDRHAAYYLALAEKAEPLSTSQSSWLRTLETEIHNLRAALLWYTERGEVEAALRLSAALWPLWVMGGHLAEGQQRLRDLLDLEAGGAYPAARAGALFTAALMAYFRQDYRAARRLYEESVALRRQVQDHSGLAASLSYLSMVAREQSDYSAARRLCSETLAIYEGMADERGIAMATCRLAEIDHIEADYVAARHGYERSLAIYRRLGRSPFLAWSLHHLGRLALDQGDHAAAGAWMREGLAVRRAEGDALGVLYSLAALANLAAAEGRPARALRLAGAAAALSTSTGTVLQPTERRSSERWLALARGAIHPGVAAAAWAEGEAMPVEQAAAYALEETVPS